MSAGPAGVRPVAVTLDRLGPEAIPFVMALERLDGYDRFVGQWSEEEHRRAMDDPQTVYFGASAGPDGPDGFALLEGVANPHGTAVVRRIAVSRPGEGFGTALLRGVLSWAFSAAGRFRVALYVYSCNGRARRAYLREGFREEGLMREAILMPDGTRTDLVPMAILRSEWRERQAR